MAIKLGIVISATVIAAISHMSEVSDIAAMKKPTT
jgi:hypothetical protein